MLPVAAVGLLSAGSIIVARGIANLSCCFRLALTRRSTGKTAEFPTFSLRSLLRGAGVLDALMMALWRRGKPKELVHHSDQGSPYTREDFQRLLAAQGIM